MTWPVVRPGASAVQPISFAPSSSGGADDLAALVALANTYAYKRPIQLVGNATYQSPAPPPQLKPGVTIYGAAGSGIVCAYTNGGTPLNADGSYKAPFNYDGVTHPSGTPGGTTLSSQAVIYGSTLSVASKAIGPGGGNISARSVSGNVTIPGSFVAVEDNVTSGAANQWAMFEVVGISGAGPYVLTLDAPVLYAFPSGAQVTNVTPGADIHLLGAGMVIMGSMARALTLNAALRCVVSDWTIYGSQCFEYASSIDSASRDSVRSNVLVYDCPNVGIATEGSTRVTNYDCRAIGGGTNPGLMFQAAYDCWAISCHASGKDGASGAGVLFGWITDPVGCRDCGVIGGSYDRNAVGAQISGSSSRINLKDASFSGNVGHGVWSLKQSSSLVPYGLRVEGCTIKGNGTSAITGGVGVYLDGVLGNIVIGNRFEDNGHTGLAMGAVGTANGAEVTVEANDIKESIGQAGAIRTNSSTDTARIFNNKIATAYAGIGYGVVVTGGAVVVTGNEFTATTDGIPLYVSAGTVRCRDLVTPTGLSYGIYQAGGTLYLLDGGQGFANCTTPVSPVGGTRNFGTLTLNGVTQVEVDGAFPIGSTILLSLKTVGGTPGTGAPYFSQAQAAGKFYVKSPTASANDVYNWQALV